MDYSRLRIIKDYLFRREEQPEKGLFAYEKVVIGYALVTLLLVLFAASQSAHPLAMAMGRLRILFITLALWAAYRLSPCPLLRFLRAAVQLALLSWWYPDTYEINRILPNLDHLFARADQWLFGLQPAWVFSETVTSKLTSELLCMSYAAYFPLILLITLFYWIYRRRHFERMMFIVLTSFFLYYLIFELIPVTGPQYYYGAIGAEQIEQGVFPEMGDYFNTHQERLPAAGWNGGFFYACVEIAHEAGERPTAAFPSSHVGVTVILLLLALQARSRNLFYFMLPFFVLMCFATVYIRAHYVVDVVAGLLTGVAFYYLLRKISGLEDPCL